MSDDVTAGLPPVVLVGPHRWVIEINAQRVKDANGAYGFSLKKQTEIVLCPDQSLSQLRDTLLHEVLHACLDMQGVAACEGDQALLTNDEEERLVRGLSPILLDVLRRNPDLVDWLTHIAADGG